MPNLFQSIVQEVKQLDDSKKQLRHFGCVVGGIFIMLLVLSVARLHFSSIIDVVLATIGGGLLFFSFFKSSYLLYPYRIWMFVALVMGHVMSTILLLFIYYGILTPIGLITRLIKGDILDQKIHKSVSTYWRPRTEPLTAKNMERLY